MFTRVVIAAQHDPTITLKELREAIYEEVIKKVIASEHLRSDTKIIINGTGRFVIGGPPAGCGMTGRKIIVDTYGGRGHHGGEPFLERMPLRLIELLLIMPVM